MTMKDIKLKIDNKEITTTPDKSIFQAAANAGIYIPSLCEHPDLPSSGECGLCLVEVKGESEPVLSCITKVANNMVVKTDTSALRQKQRAIMEQILLHHPNACITCWRRERCKPFDICLRNVDVNERCVTCPKNGRCELQKVADFIDLKSDVIPYEPRNLPVNRDNPYFELDYNLCIACGRCVRACNDLRGIKALDFIEINGYKVAGPKKGTHAESGCKYCFSCVEVCPTGALVDIRWRYQPSPEDWDAYVVPCRDACPAHIDIPRYLYLIAQGKYSEALAVVREKVPFPGTLGRVCIHPCEQACRRNDLNHGEPLCIKFLKRFASDNDNGLWKQNSKKEPSTGKKVAVVGSGPAGLTTAYYLAKKGHTVTVFEALSKTGGMMRVGIPRYRLPAEILDSEINEIAKAGVEIIINKRIESLDGLLEQGFNAVFVGIGAHKGMKAGIKGEDIPGVMDGVDFLRRVGLGETVQIGKNIGVVGGGNAAVDCARTAIRLGAKKVTMFYRRTRAEMPAAPEEVMEALHEGIVIEFLCAPNEVRTKKDGTLEFECTRMKLGEPDASGRPRPEPIPGSEFTTILDNLISSIGQTADIPEEYQLETGRGNVIKANKETLETNKPGIFAGGDIVTGPASVIGAIAQGRQAAKHIDIFLGGDGAIEEELTTREIPDPIFGQDLDFTGKHQAVMPCIHDKERLKSFSEVETGYSENVAVEEAERCFRCDMRLRITPPVSPPKKIKAA
jgi:formate dehydrogenase beta subunit